MNRYAREKPHTGGARAAVNFYWNEQPLAVRLALNHAARQNLAWYEVRRALLFGRGHRDLESWCQEKARLCRVVFWTNRDPQLLKAGDFKTLTHNTHSLRDPS